MRRGVPPVHLSHTYLDGSAKLDVIEQVVRGTAGTYTGAHGAILARYGHAISVAYNLLAYDRDPREDRATRTAAVWALEKPAHDRVRYDAFDPLIGDLIEVARDRSGAAEGAAWRGKLGLARTPEYWIEWRSTTPFAIADLDGGLRAWRAPRAVKAGAVAGWRLLATRIG